MSRNAHKVDRVLTDTPALDPEASQAGGQGPGRVEGASSVIRKPADSLKDPLVDLHTLEERIPIVGEVRNLAPTRPERWAGLGFGSIRLLRSR